MKHLGYILDSWREGERGGERSGVRGREVEEVERSGEKWSEGERSGVRGREVK